MGPWYLDADDVYVSADVGAYPMRQGDVIAGPDDWLAAQLVHPTCELPKKAVDAVQVVRVRPLSDLGDDKQRSRVVAGFQEREGALLIAAAHTFFLPPWTADGEPCFANFRELITVSRDTVQEETRVAAITHEARVTFVRRWLYFRFRLNLDIETVYGLEAARISADPAFAGPRPEWAEPPPDDPGPRFHIGKA